MGSFTPDEPLKRRVTEDERAAFDIPEGSIIAAYLDQDGDIVWALEESPNA